MNWEDHESKRMESAGMEPLGCERHGWADPRGSGFRAEAESSGATWTGSPKGVFEGRKHHEPRLALNNMAAGVRDASEWRGGDAGEIAGQIGGPKGASGKSGKEGKAAMGSGERAGKRTSVKWG